MSLILLALSWAGFSEAGLPSKEHYEKPSGSGGISHETPLSASVGSREATQPGSGTWLPVLLGVLINPSLFLPLVPESGIKKVMILFSMLVL